MSERAAEKLDSVAYKPAALMNKNESEDLLDEGLLDLMVTCAWSTSVSQMYSCVVYSNWFPIQEFSFDYEFQF